MVVGSFIDRLGQFMSWLFQRQWSEWVITIAGIALFVVIWIMKRQRKLALRNIYDNQFLESTPIIGAKLGFRKKHRHLIGNFKRAQQAAVQKGHSNQQTSAQKTESEELCEQIKQLRYEIIKRKQTEVRFEQQVSHLTAANEKLQLELAEKKPADEQFRHVVHDTKQIEQIPERQAGEVRVADGQQQPKVSESKQVEQIPKQQVITEPTVEKQVEEKSAEKGDKHDDLHRVVDGVKQKLCRKCEEWKPESEFHRNTSTKDGLAGSCKTCKANAAREYRRRRKAAND